MSKILLIDSYNMIHRAHHGFSFGDHSTTFGFFRCLKSEIDRHNPDKVFLVSEGYPKHRFIKFGDYKSNRTKKRDDSFSRQKKDIFDISKNLPVTIIRHPDYECDDVIGMLCRDYCENNEVVICSSDSDFIQLLDLDNVKLWNPIRKTFIDRWPVNYLMWKSLKGDPSDNIPGVKGVGDKTAHKLALDLDLFKLQITDNPVKKAEYDISYSLIELADICNKDKLINRSDYSFNESITKEAFQERNFKSIVGKSWEKWKISMENLNERCKKASN